MKKLSVIVVLLVIISACAVVKPPQGGPKDVAAPVAETQYPANKTTNFRDKQLYISFDEFIALKNFTTEVVVNPYYLPTDIKTEVKGKKLEVSFNEPLQANTTYSINFGKSIVDITEANPIEDYTITFSTGPSMDSLKVIGKINKEGAKGTITKILVGLYPLHDTINPTKDKALYTTNTIDSNFVITNLPEQEYQIFAFDDVNKNLLYDSLTEHIAFLNQTINTTNKDTLNLNIFKEDTRSFKLNRPIYKDNFVEITFSKGLKEIDCKLPYLYQEKDNKLLVYEQDMNITQLKLSVKDSSNLLIDTTLEVLESKSKFIDSTLTLGEPNLYNNKKPFEGLVFNFNHKLKSINKDSLIIVINKDTVKHTSPLVNINIDADNNMLYVNSKNPLDTLYLTLRPKALQSYSGHTSKFLSTRYVPVADKTYGNISGTITTDEKQYILYLCDAKGKELYQITNPTYFDFKYLNPSSYTLKILVDSNNNGFYDTGDLQTKKQPETIIKYEKVINVKSNWEVGNVNITF